MYLYIKKVRCDEELIKNVDMPILLKKIIIKWKKTFNIVTIKKLDKLHYLYIIPRVDSIKVIEKIIKKNYGAKIILSKELKKYEKELNLRKENKIIRYFINDILKYIMDKINMEIELQNIYILANEYNERNLEVIKYLIDKVKTVNIVTNNIKRYNVLEEKLYNEEGILITVTNNKNKGLKRAVFIVNLDFDNQTFSEYKVNRSAIIINCTNEKINMLKYFQGIIINNIEITLKEKEEQKILYKDFDKIDLYESFQNENMKYVDNIRKIEANRIKIVNLIGNNRTIDIKEVLNIQKNLDKI